MNETVKKENKNLFLTPVIGPILGSVLAYLLSELGIAFVINFLVRTIFKVDRDVSILYYTWYAAVGGVITLFLFKAMFRRTFKGCYNGNWGDKKLKIIILIVAAANLLMLILGFITAGMQAPTFMSIGNCLMPGICEEVAFRLIPISLAMYVAKDQKGINSALIISSILFGLVHLTNLTSGQSLSGTLIQLVVTLGMGVFLGAVYIRTGNFFITVIFHTVYDFIGMLQASASGLKVDMGGQSIISYIPQAIIVVLYVIAGIIILKGHTDEVLAVWKDRWSKED